jgi:hypothetical protein
LPFMLAWRYVEDDRGVPLKIRDGVPVTEPD